MIKRYMENVIEESLKHFPIVLLTGPRQIGKSTLLYTKFISKGYSYISFDDQFDLMLAKSDPKTFLSTHKYPLIIDEMQRAPEIFPELERIVNESRLKNGNIKSNGMYILSGSQRKELLDKATESLSGRVAILDMSNLSLNEIFGVNNETFDIDFEKCFKKSLRYKIDNDSIFDVIVRGFFPGLYDDKEIKTNIFYSSYLTTYLEKDLKQILNINDEFKFLNFVKLLASNTAQELVYDYYSRQIGVSLNTIKTWISALEKTGIIFLLRPYNEDSFTKTIVKRPKVYFFDTGLASYLIGIDSGATLQKSIFKGRLFETFVINEIRKSYINSSSMHDMYYYRDKAQNEIDLILLKNGQISCVEIKSGQSFNSSFTKAFKIIERSKFEKGKNAIICTIDKASILNDGTILIPISSI